MESEQIPLAYSLNIESSNQFLDIITEQRVNLPTDVDVHQMGNIRCVILTRRLRQKPFDIIKIDDFWFIKQILHPDLSNSLKQGDRLLIINKTTISNRLYETDIFKLMFHSSVPFLIWVSWDVDKFLKYQLKSQQFVRQDTYIDAKAHLLKTKQHEEISLYDHLAYIIGDALQNPQANINDLLEKLNYPILRSDLRLPKNDADLMLTKIHAQLLQGKERYLLNSKDFASSIVPYLMDIANYCTNAGYGIHPTEIILIWSAMKRLNDRINCTEMKFWGKIFGLRCNYYIVQIQNEKEISLDEIDIIGSKLLLKTEKRLQYTNQPAIQTESMEIPNEPHGVGTNQYTYFVTNSPGLPWIKLPDVKPAMIDHARQIRCFFTGCLSSLVNGFPPFIGVEKDYLRAQIARITATTHISPAGFYILSDTETDEEEGEGETTVSDHYKEPKIRINSEFNDDVTNPITAELLADENLQEWVHSLPEILPQGRTRFWRPPSFETTTTTSHGGEEDEDEDILDENKLQIPAPLLQPIGDDKLMHTDQTPWSIGLTMSIMREYSMCYVRSNIWPGAFTLGHAEKYFNLYVGWGQKYEEFNPSQPPLPKDEFAQEFLEKNDPSVETEKAFEEARRTITSELTSEEDINEEDEEEEMTEEED